MRLVTHVDSIGNSPRLVGARARYGLQPSTQLVVYQFSDSRAVIGDLSAGNVSDSVEGIESRVTSNCGIVGGTNTIERWR